MNRLGRVALAAVLVALAVGVSGCGGTEPTSTADPSPQECGAVKAQPVGAGAPSVALLLDRTASMGSAVLPAPVRQRVADIAQAAGDQPAAAVVYQVGGSGAELVNSAWPLSFPAAGTARRERLVAMSLTCLEQETQLVQPSAAGSDVVTALGQVLAAHPGATVLVHTDGLGTTGPVNLSTLGFDNAVVEVVEQVERAGAVPRAQGASVTFAGLGATREGLAPASVTAYLGDLYCGLVKKGGGTCDLVAAPAPIVQRDVRQADPVVSWPQIETVRVAKQTTVTIPAVLLFAPDSANLRSGELPQEVTDTAQAVASDPSARIVVEGHTATWGSLAYRQDLSQRRATAVAEALVALGVAPAAIQTVGRGSSDPVAVDVTADGSLDPAAAAKNRRVVIRTISS